MPHLTDAKIKKAVDRVVRAWWSGDSAVEEREQQIAMAKRHGREATSFLYSIRVASVAELAQRLWPSTAPSTAQLLRWAKRWPNGSAQLDSGISVILVRGPRFELTGPHQLAPEQR